MGIVSINNYVYLNIIVWVAPILFIKGLSRYYILLLVIIFSGSYWGYVPVHYGFELPLPGNIIEKRILDALKYSIVAGIFFHLGIFCLLRKVARTSTVIMSNKFCNPLCNIPNFPVSILLIRVIATISILYSLVIATSQIGISSRIEFMETVSPLWYSTLIPVNTLLLCIMIAYTFKRYYVKFSGRCFWLFALIFTHVLLVGFDGSRRFALPPILFLGICTFLSWVGGSMKKSLMVKSLIYVAFLLSFSSFLSLGRSFNVGWQIFAVDIPVMEFLPGITSMVVAPMSTLHVNTQMADYINVEGAQGYRYYFNAIGNTLFPRFLFRQYFFGDPLVTVLHERFGWYGQDFGFLAEAIYSGGMYAVAILHFLFGCIVAAVLNGISKGRLLSLSLGVGLLFGCLNSLRSDFMNLLKATLYPGLFLYLVLFLAQKIRVSRKKNSGAVLKEA